MILPSNLYLTRTLYAELAWTSLKTLHSDVSEWATLIYPKYWPNQHISFYIWGIRSVHLMGFLTLQQEWTIEVISFRERTHQAYIWQSWVPLGFKFIREQLKTCLCPWVHDNQNFIQKAAMEAGNTGSPLTWRNAGEVCILRTDLSTESFFGREEQKTLASSGNWRQAAPPPRVVKIPLWRTLTL